MKFFKIQSFTTYFFENSFNMVSPLRILSVALLISSFKLLLEQNHAIYINQKISLAKIKILLHTHCDMLHSMHRLCLSILCEISSLGHFQRTAALILCHCEQRNNIGGNTFEFTILTHTTFPQDSLNFRQIEYL